MAEAGVLDAPPTKFAASYVRKKEAEIRTGADLQPAWMVKLAESEAKMRILKSEARQVSVEVGSDDEPAHSFRFAWSNNNANSSREIEKKIVGYFQDHPEAGIVMRTGGSKDGGLSGVITPGQITLREILTDFRTITYEITQEISGSRVAALVAELGERNLSLRRIGENDVVADISQAVGQTHLAWFEKQWRAGAFEGASNITWVTPEFIEDTRNHVRRTASFRMKRQDDVDRFGDPVKIEAPRSKAKQVFTVRNVEKFDPEGIKASVLRRKKKSKSVSVPDINLRSANTPREGMMDLYAGPDWRKRIKQEGMVEMELPGMSFRVDVDFSGMSRMVALGEGRAGEAISGTVFRFTEPLRKFFEDQDIVISTAGDSVTIWVPKQERPIGDQIKRISEMVAISSREFPEICRTLANANFMGKDFFEHEAGIKAVVSLTGPQEKTKIRVYRGGVTSVSGSEGSEELLSRGETLAKKGGRSVAIIVPQEMTDEMQRELGGRNILVEREGGGKSILAIEGGLPIVEQIFASGLVGYKDKELAKRLTEHYDQAKEIVEGNLRDFSETGNNDLGVAKILFAVISEVGENPQDHVGVDGLLKELYSNETYLWLHILIENLDGITMPAYSSGSREVQQVGEVLSKIMARKELQDIAI